MAIPDMPICMSTNRSEVTAWLASGIGPAIVAKGRGLAGACEGGTSPPKTIGSQYGILSIQSSATDAATGRQSDWNVSFSESRFSISSSASGLASAFSAATVSTTAPTCSKQSWRCGHAVALPQVRRDRAPARGLRQSSSARGSAMQ